MSEIVLDKETKELCDYLGSFHNVFTGPPDCSPFDKVNGPYYISFTPFETKESEKRKMYEDISELMTQAKESIASYISNHNRTIVRSYPRITHRAAGQSNFNGVLEKWPEHYTCFWRLLCDDGTRELSTTNQKEN